VNLTRSETMPFGFISSLFLNQTNIPSLCSLTKNFFHSPTKPSACVTYQQSAHCSTDKYFITALYHVGNRNSNSHMLVWWTFTWENRV